MSTLLQRHQRTLELDRPPLDFTPDILELTPHPQIFVPEQPVTARGDPSVVDTWRGRTWRSLRSVAPASGPDGHSVILVVGVVDNVCAEAEVGKLLLALVLHLVAALMSHDLRVKRSGVHLTPSPRIGLFHHGDLTPSPRMLLGAW